MLQIQIIQDTISDTNRALVQQVQDILRGQLPDESEESIAAVCEYLQNPMKFLFRAMLYVAMDFDMTMRGFGLSLHFSDINFCFLDYLVAAKDEDKSIGLMEVLYRRIREDALELGAFGLFLECGPDNAQLCSDPNTLEQNIENMMFYELMGARPIINTKYETPVIPNEDNAPYLLFDDLGKGKPLQRDNAAKIVQSILERKYKDIASRQYVRTVIDSFTEDPVRLRPHRYQGDDEYTQSSSDIPDHQKIAFIINEKHIIHKVKKRGYLESPFRIISIQKELELSKYFKKVIPQHFAEKHIRAVHDPDFVDYVKYTCLKTEPAKSLYPYIFPIRNPKRVPCSMEYTAGYYCMDFFTPLNKNAYIAAKGSVDCALTGAQCILESRGLAYALVRPPGHHAEKRHYGGFCYFNSTSIAAHYLSKYGRIAILDLDFHHGNGHQNIFYTRDDVLTISIHRDPGYEFPFFAGFKEETGEGKGRGYNVNYPLGETVDGGIYLGILKKAVERVKDFDPSFLVVALGLDTSKGDPNGSWTLLAKDFEENGRIIGGLKLPTLVVQEGGYNTRVLGRNVRFFFTGLWMGTYKERV